MEAEFSGAKIINVYEIKKPKRNVLVFCLILKDKKYLT